MTNAASSLTSRRSPFHGTLQILRFNWSQYATALIAIAVAIAIASVAPLPGWLAALLFIAAAGAFYFIVASIVASWLIYDHSPLCQWHWINDFHSGPVDQWMLLHTGLDETSPWLRSAHAGKTGIVYDVFDPALMTEKSIHRARKQGGAPPCPAADWNSLPQPSGSVDTVFMIMSVHEFRDTRSRDQVFSEAARTLRPGGQLLLVEHLRDTANFAVFGPGFMHFWPRTVWLSTASRAELQLQSERKITPWVHVFLFIKPSSEIEPQ